MQLFGILFCCHNEMKCESFGVHPSYSFGRGKTVTEYTYVSFVFWRVGWLAGTTMPATELPLSFGLWGCLWKTIHCSSSWPNDITITKVTPCDMRIMLVWFSSHPFVSRQKIYRTLLFWTVIVYCAMHNDYMHFLDVFFIVLLIVENKRRDEFFLFDFWFQCFHSYVLTSEQSKIFSSDILYNFLLKENQLN